MYSESFGLTYSNFRLSVTSVSEDATPGPHVLTCEVMQETKDPGGGHEFRLIAVDAS